MAFAVCLPCGDGSCTSSGGVPQDYALFGSVGPDMMPVGYGVDVAKYIAEKLVAKIEQVPVTSTSRIPYVLTNNADMIISVLGKVART